MHRSSDFLPQICYAASVQNRAFHEKRQKLIQSKVIYRNKTRCMEKVTSSSTLFPPCERETWRNETTSDIWPPWYAYYSSRPDTADTIVCKASIRTEEQMESVIDIAYRNTAMFPALIRREL